jgi:hypothetical protein
MITSFLGNLYLSVFFFLMSELEYAWLPLKKLIRHPGLPAQSHFELDGTTDIFKVYEIVGD